jgi:hypothetical protein
MRRSKNIGVALIGLLVVAAISVAAGSGRKPARQERARTSVRVLSDVETDQLGRRFPGLRARVQITGDLLERLFPRTAFYRAVLPNRGVIPAYLTAISDSGPITMPDGFNRLLGMYNTEVNDKNKVEMAKAFVLMAIGDEPNYNPETNYPTGLDSFPPVTFVDADVTEHRINYFPYGVELKVKIDEHLEVWHFAIAMGKFIEVLRKDPSGRTINFYIPGRFVPPADRSQPDKAHQEIKTKS